MVTISRKVEAVRTATYDKIYDVARRQNASKKGRSEGFKAVREEYLATFPEGSEVDVNLIKTYFADLVWEASRRLVLDERTRLDGRKLDEIRPISTEAGLLPGPPCISCADLASFLLVGRAVGSGLLVSSSGQAGTRARQPSERAGSGLRA